MSAARRALRAVLNGNRFTAAELADVAGTTISAIHSATSCSEDRADLSALRYELLARWLCEHGERRVSLAYVSADCAICLRNESSADGRIDDEIRSMVEAMAEVSKAHTAKDAARMDLAVDLVDRILSQLRAEQALIR